MSKQIVFLSHSSKDKKALAAFKSALDEKTHGTIEFFLSSDGQSIPFGRNWLSTVGTALDEAKLAFVFLTPNSIGSTWVAFEAGYMHAKKIQVIPIALPGIEMGQVPQPLSLLQGFNMHSHEAMNNVFAILNDVFNHKHAFAFSDPDFRKIFGAESSLAAGYFGEYSALIREVEFRGKADGDLVSALRDGLAKQSIDLTPGDMGEKLTAAAPGIRVEIDKNQQFEVTVHAEMCSMVLTTVAQAVGKVVTGKSRTSVEFASGVGECGGKLSVTARAFGTNIKVLSDGNLNYDGVLLPDGVYNPLHLESETPMTAELIREIVVLLLDRRMLILKPNGTEPVTRFVGIPSRFKR